MRKRPSANPAVSPLAKVAATLTTYSPTRARIGSQVGSVAASTSRKPVRRRQLAEKEGTESAYKKASIK